MSLATGETQKGLPQHLLQEMKMRGEKIPCSTAYDYSMAKNRSSRN